MKKKIIALGIICGSLLISISFLVAANVLAQIEENSGSDETITYPVKELENCKDKNECKTYCDKPGNLEVCLNFAEKNNLMSGQELEKAKKFLKAGAKGPGGCTNKESCETFCDNIENISECVTFAEKNGLMNEEELKEAKKVQAAIAKGVKPPACKNKRDCDVYCEDQNHMEECVTFAEAAGLMSEEEQADAQKMLQAIKKGAKPPACRGKKECDKYCSEDEHLDECVVFAETAGFMSKDEAEMAKKTRGKGPGGCKGKEECDAFCSNPNNEQTCFDFGKENGFIPPEDLKKMEEGSKMFHDSLENAPPEVAQCLSETLGNETLEKLKNGTMRPNRQSGDKMGECFRKMEEKMRQEENSRRPDGENSDRDNRDNMRQDWSPNPEDQRRRGGENGENRQQFQSGEQRFPYQEFRCEGENCQRPPQGEFPMEGKQPKKRDLNRLMGEFPPMSPGQRSDTNFQMRPGNYQPPSVSSPNGSTQQAPTNAPMPSNYPMLTEPRQPMDFQPPPTNFNEPGLGSFEPSPISPPPPQPSPTLLPPPPPESGGESAPAPQPTSFVSPESMLGSVIMFLNSLNSSNNR